MTEQQQAELDKLAEEVRTTFAHGGPFAHNIISLTLTRMAKIDKDAATKLYNEICEEGF